jgi:hypothetical protein
MGRTRGALAAPAGECLGGSERLEPGSATRAGGRRFLLDEELVEPGVAYVPDVVPKWSQGEPIVAFDAYLLLELSPELV